MFGTTVASVQTPPQSTPNLISRTPWKSIRYVLCQPIFELWLVENDILTAQYPSRRDRRWFATNLRYGLCDFPDFTAPAIKLRKSCRPQPSHLMHQRSLPLRAKARRWKASGPEPARRTHLGAEKHLIALSIVSRTPTPAIAAHRGTRCLSLSHTRSVTN